MTIETVAIESIAMDPANARKHGQRNLAAIEGSLRRFGQQKPIVVDKNNIVRAGNGTLAAAKALGWKEIRIVRSELAAGELTAFAIADNRSAELAEWDTEVLAELLADDTIGDVGFDTSEIEALLKEPMTGLDFGGGDGDEGALGRTGLGSGLGEAGEFESKFEVVVECADEGQQKEVFERLRAEGLTCRLFTL